MIYNVFCISKKILLKPCETECCLQGKKNHQLKARSRAFCPAFTSFALGGKELTQELYLGMILNIYDNKDANPAESRFLEFFYFFFAMPVYSTSEIDLARI